MDNKFLIGLDLGQAKDYTALTIIEKIEYTEYHLRHLERYPLGTSYVEIVDKLKELVENEKLKDQESYLIVDATGVGQPVVDLIYEKNLHCIPITITGGNDVIKDHKGYKVPKKVLVSNLQVLFQNDKLKLARELPLIDTLVEELLNFKAKINLKGNESFEAWRESIHDDLVLAVALAVWFGENVPSPGIFIVEEPYEEGVFNLNNHFINDIEF